MLHGTIFKAIFNAIFPATNKIDNLTCVIIHDNLEMH